MEGHYTGECYVTLEGRIIDFNSKLILLFRLFLAWRHFMIWILCTETSSLPTSSSTRTVKLSLEIWMSARSQTKRVWTSHRLEHLTMLGRSFYNLLMNLSYTIIVQKFGETSLTHSWVISGLSDVCSMKCWLSSHLSSQLTWVVCSKKSWRVIIKKFLCITQPISQLFWSRCSKSSKRTAQVVSN